MTQNNRTAYTGYGDSHPLGWPTWEIRAKKIFGHAATKRFGWQRYNEYLVDWRLRRIEKHLGLRHDE